MDEEEETDYTTCPKCGSENIQSCTVADYCGDCDATVFYYGGDPTLKIN